MGSHAGKSRALIAFALVGAGGVRTAHAAPPAVFNLGTLGGATSYGYAINASGQVAGSSLVPGDASRHAFLYTGTPGSGGVMYDLGTLGGTYSDGFGINAGGQVVGWGSVGDFVHAFRYTGTPDSGGAMADLGTLGGSASWGLGINDARQVTGWAFLPRDAGHHAYRYTGTPSGGGDMADLGTLGGQNSVGSAINTVGQVVGSSQATIGDDAPYHAFLYTGTPGSGGVMADLGTLGGSVSAGYALNAGGQVTGESYMPGEENSHAFLYTGTPGSGGAMADLGTLGGSASKGNAINADGEVVGFSYTTANGDSHAFLYTGTPGLDGQMIDLDAWLDANNPAEGAKWTLAEAFGLSDGRLITGYGTYDDGPGGLSDGGRAFILDASALVPEPGGLALLALGVPVLLRHRTRRLL